MKYTALATLAIAITAAGMLAAIALGGNGNGQDKVTICHKPDNQSIELSVGDPAVQAHLNHGDTLGPCESETTPTDTTPPPTTTTPPPTTTTPPPSGGNSSSASVYCDFDHYVVIGIVDGQAADSADPATISGTYQGWTNVTLHRGDTSFRTAVYTYGDCKPANLSSLRFAAYRWLKFYK